MSEQTIITRKTNFTVVDNGFINDPKLSWRAKGILLYMLSKPANWKYNPKGDMLKKATDGQASLYSGIKELIVTGYISRTRNKDGFLKYHIFEDKNDNQIPDCMLQPIDSKPDHGNPDQGNPHQDNPDKENPDQGNHDVLINTDSSNTEYSNTDDSKHTPSSDDDSVSQPQEKEIEEPKEEKFDFLQALINLGADEKRAKNLVTNRNKKRLAMHESIIDHMIQEGEKAGLTLPQVVEICALKGWGGFEARYYRSEKPKHSHDLSQQDYSKNNDTMPDWMIQGMKAEGLI